MCIWLKCNYENNKTEETGCVYGDVFAANMERSGLYLKLFKLVFGSVSLLAAENEQMLKVMTSHSASDYS